MAYIKYEDDIVGSDDWSQISRGDILLVQSKTNYTTFEWVIVVQSIKGYSLPLVSLRNGCMLDHKNWLITNKPGVPGCDVFIHISTVHTTEKAYGD
jgi:hypothetical protein